MEKEKKEEEKKENREAAAAGHKFVWLSTHQKLKSSEKSSKHPKENSTAGWVCATGQYPLSYLSMTLYILYIIWIYTVFLILSYLQN